MSQLAKNIRFLRKQEGLTQAALAEKIGVKRAVISTYEEAKAEPKLLTLRILAKFFGYNIHQLVEQNLDGTSKTPFDSTGQNLRILPIAIEKEEQEERISLIPVKASAGYTTGYADAEFVQSLPHFTLPFAEVSKAKTYRVFQTQGDSMLPIKNGDYIICEYMANWNDVKDNSCCVVITRNEGVVYKRVVNKLESSGELMLISDNTDYEPYYIKGADILEVWKALGFTSFDLPDGKPQFVNLQNITETLKELQEDVKALKAR